MSSIHLCCKICVRIFLMCSSDGLISSRWTCSDSSPLFRHFKFVDIRRATDNFSNIIGQGGFGTVYKAKFEDGLIAAVKRMNKGVQQGEEDFSKEMELLGRLHHRHLVTLRGFCIERHDRSSIQLSIKLTEYKTLFEPGRFHVFSLGLWVSVHFHCTPEPS